MTKKQAINLLNNIKKMAIEASLTGALASGDQVLMEIYNNVLKIAISENWVEDGIIPEIKESMFNENTENVDVIGTCAALLQSLLIEE